MPWPTLFPMNGHTGTPIKHVLFRTQRSGESGELLRYLTSFARLTSDQGLPQFDREKKVHRRNALSHVKTTKARIQRRTRHPQPIRRFRICSHQTDSNYPRHSTSTLCLFINTTLTKQGNFLTWHRYYTWAFEQALRNECRYDGYQPYWAWNKYAHDPINSPLFDGSDYSLSGNGEYASHNATPVAPITNVPPGRGGGCVTTGPFRKYVLCAPLYKRECSLI